MGCAERLRGLREILSQRASTANFEQVEVTAPLDGSSLRQCDAIVLDESPLSLAAIGAIGLGNPSPHFVAFGRDAMLFPLLRECTIIDYAGEEIGRRLSHALLQRIESGPESPPQHVLVAPRIVNPTEDGDR